MTFKMIGQKPAYQFLLFSFVLMFCFSGKAHAQKNYFYGSMKVPVEAFITSMLTEPEIINGVEQYKGDTSNGFLFDLGYGIPLHRYFTVEAGAELYLYSPKDRKYQHPQPETDVYDELKIIHRTVAFQLKPVLTFDLDDEQTMFRISCGLNYQKLSSTGIYDVFQALAQEQVFKERLSTRSASGYAFTCRPAIGLDFMLSEKWGAGFDLTYVTVDWNKNLEQLKFNRLNPVSIRGDKSSGVFLSMRVLFR
ncbi:hypothetical protein [Pedobacter sp.]|uniref:hypothetical protein n=1 Tax=Pedobacter sp. TaxID=1411316 RepID=UPI003D7FD501